MPFGGTHHHLINLSNINTYLYNVHISMTRGNNKFENFSSMQQQPAHLQSFKPFELTSYSKIICFYLHSEEIKSNVAKLEN